MKPRILLLGALLAAAHSAPAAAQAPAPETALNMAGRQRMLSQRIVKAYCQIGLGVAAQAARVQLNDSLERFEIQSRQLAAAAPDRAAREALADLDLAWQPFRQAALAPPGAEGARLLHSLGEGLLAAAERVTRLFEPAAAAGLGRLVNVAGRQRMLSQRQATFYMLRRWGIDSPAVDAGGPAARAQFAAGLALLRAAPENSAAIAQELAAVSLQWEWFERALDLEGDYSYAAVVADSSERMLAGLERLTRLYEELAASQRPPPNARAM